MDKASLKSITTARLEIIPRERRAQALALMARTSRKTLRSVERGDQTLVGDAENNDIVLGLYVLSGPACIPNLCGLAQLRERYAPITALGVNEPRTEERAFLIDAVIFGDEMRNWNPSVRALLIASAASLIATTAHDPRYRTYVACRVAENDDDLQEVLQAIGGRRLTAPPGVDLGRFRFNDVPSNELRFLDDASAAKAAAILMAHLGATISFARDERLPPQRSFDSLLSIDFSRPIKALIEEIEWLACCRIEVGWHSPRIISNDAGFPMRVVNG